MNDSGRPVVLIICDGWGVAASDPAEIARRGDAVAMARTPVRDRLLKTRPWGLLATSGEAVGLPAGQMGNSEVGHLNLGAGRIVHQDVTRISMAIRDGSFFDIAALRELADAVRGSGGALHLIGLCSDGGVHSDISHLRALLDWRSARDSRRGCMWSPTVATRRRLRDRVDQGAGGRDAHEAATAESPPSPDATTRWTATAAGRAPNAPTEPSCRAPARAWRGASVYVARCYDEGVTDEFLDPVVVGAPDGIRPGDGILFFNFRADRARQLTAALMDATFPHFERPRGPCNRLVAMTRYEDDLRPSRPLPAAHPRTTCSARCSLRPDARSSAWRKRRNTRTSPTSSTAGSRSPFPARAATSCRRRRSPPTTSSPR